MFYQIQLLFLEKQPTRAIRPIPFGDMPHEESLARNWLIALFLPNQEIPKIS